MCGAKGGLLLFGVLCLCLVQACGNVDPQNRGQLLTDLGSHSHVFRDAEVGKSQRRSFTIYNPEGFAPIIVSRLTLVGSPAFKLESPPAVSFALEGGLSKGKKITIVYTPTVLQSESASLTISVKNISSINGRDDVRITFAHTVAPVRLRWSCSGRLDFGALVEGASLEKECTITNIGVDDVTFTGVGYKKLLGEDASSFKWVSPSFPVVLKSETGVGMTIRVRYAPPDSGAREEGRFTLQTKRVIQRDVDRPRLVVAGRTQGALLSLVPVYPTCSDDAFCRRIDAILSCQLDDVSGENRCARGSLDTPLLKFSYASPGEVLRLPFLLRNRGELPLSISKVAISGDPGFKFVAEGVVFPLVLKPNEEKRLGVEYGPYKRGAKAILTVTSNAVKGSNDKMELEASNGDCHLEYLPTRLHFERAGRAALEMYNRGTIPCQILDVQLKSQASKVFTLVSDGVKGTPVQTSQKRLLDVLFSPKDREAHSDVIVVTTTDPDQPTVEIPLSGQVKQATGCLLKVGVSRLNFGLLRSGHQEQRLVTLQNQGGSACRLIRARVNEISPGVPSGFQVDASALPTDLAAGGQLGLLVTYKASAKVLFNRAELEIEGGGDTHRVELMGASSPTCLEVLPGGLEFGDVKVGCGVGRQALTLFKRPMAGCPATITLEKLWPRNAMSGFRIDQAPPLPLAVKDGQSVSLVLSYKPKRMGVELTNLHFEVTGDRDSSLVIPLSGAGVAEEQVQDRFVQERKPRWDILWVIDDSSSMAEEQTILKSNLEVFINWLIRSNIDYRVLVTTTDVTGKRAGAGCARGKVRVLEPRTQNPTTTFADTGFVGTSGDDQGSGLEAMVAALSSPAKEGCNVGFYRPGALLSVLIVSDEDDQGASPVSYYASFLRSLKGRLRQDLLQVGVIVGPQPSGCEKARAAKATAGKRYLDFAQQIGARTVSICNESWGLGAPQVGTFVGFRLRYGLSRPAMENSLVVRVDGKAIRKSEFDGWRYDGVKNEVIFATSAMPGPGATIQIDYLASCLQ